MTWSYLNISVMVPFTVSNFENTYAARLIIFFEMFEI